MKKLLAISLIFLLCACNTRPAEKITGICPDIVIIEKGSAVIYDSIFYYKGEFYNFNFLLEHDTSARSYKRRLEILKFELDLLLNQPEYSQIKDSPLYALILQAHTDKQAKAIVNGLFKAGLLALYMQELEKSNDNLKQLYSGCSYPKEYRIYDAIQIFTNKEKTKIYNAIRFQEDKAYQANITAKSP